MKTVELFLDESGDLRQSRPMNLTGLALVCDSENGRDAFHASLYQKLSERGRLAGVCEMSAPNSGARPEEIAQYVVVPETYLPKRPQDGNWSRFWSEVGKIAEIANQTAKENHGVLIAFSLQFSSSTKRRWGTSDTALDQLLDRPYGECLKDVLELLLFETPQIKKALDSDDGCVLSVNLPTRTYGAVVEDGPIEEEINRAWTDWGLDARAERDRDSGQPEIVAPTLDPGDAIEILTTVLNRRPHPGKKLLVEQARCCKLVSWDQWEMPWAQNPRQIQNKRYWSIRSSPRPKQLHFMADLISNGIYNQAISPNHQPYLPWFHRGFVLSAVSEQAAEWIGAVRAFANGDRVSAVKTAHDLCKDPSRLNTKTWLFFKRCAVGWPDQLTGEDMRKLFGELE